MGLEPAGHVRGRRADGSSGANSSPTDTCFAWTSAPGQRTLGGRGYVPFRVRTSPLGSGRSLNSSDPRAGAGQRPHISVYPSSAETSSDPRPYQSKRCRTGPVDQHSDGPARDLAPAKAKQKSDWSSTGALQPRKWSRPSGRFNIQRFSDSKLSLRHAPVQPLVALASNAPLSRRGASVARCAGNLGARFMSSVT